MHQKRTSCHCRLYAISRWVTTESGSLRIFFLRLVHGFGRTIGFVLLAMRRADCFGGCGMTLWTPSGSLLCLGHPETAFMNLRVLCAALKARCKSILVEWH